MLGTIFILPVAMGLTLFACRRLGKRPWLWLLLTVVYAATPLAISQVGLKPKRGAIILGVCATIIASLLVGGFFASINGTPRGYASAGALSEYILTCLGNDVFRDGSSMVSVENKTMVELNHAFPLTFFCSVVAGILSLHLYGITIASRFGFLASAYLIGVLGDVYRTTGLLAYYLYLPPLQSPREPLAFNFYVIQAVQAFVIFAVASAIAVFCLRTKPRDPVDVKQAELNRLRATLRT